MKTQKIIRIIKEQAEKNYSSAVSYYENNFEKITVFSRQRPCLCLSLKQQYGGHRNVQSVNKVATSFLVSLPRNEVDKVDSTINIIVYLFIYLFIYLFVYLYIFYFIAGTKTFRSYRSNSC